MTKDEALKLALEALVAVHIEGDVECVVTPTNGTIYLRPAIAAIKEALAQPERRWVGLTEEDITKIDQGIYPTWKDEVQAVEAKLRELNAPQIDPNQWAFDNGLEST